HLRAEDLRRVVDVLVLLGEAEDVADGPLRVAELPPLEEAALLEARDRGAPGERHVETDPEGVEGLADVAVEGIAVERREGEERLVRMGDSEARDVPVAEVRRDREAAREAFFGIREIAPHVAGAE